MLRQSIPRTLLLCCCFAAAPSCSTNAGNANPGQQTAAGGNTTHSGGSMVTTFGSNPGSGGNVSGASGSATGGEATNGTGGLASAGSPSGGSSGARASTGGAANAGSSTGGVPSAGGPTGGTSTGGSANGGSAQGGSSPAGAGKSSSGASNPSSGGAATGGGSAKGGSTAGGASSAGTGGTSSTSGTGGGPWTFPAGVTKPKLMIVGDSISAGPGCYKKYLLKNLTDNHYSNFEFVGQYSDDCGGGVRHSAVSCSTAEQFTQATFTMPNCSQGTTFPGMSTLMNTHKPDLVMLQLGVNDVWGGRATDAILGSYATLVQQARAQNGNVVVVVAQINKIRPDCSTSDAVTRRAEALVSAVPAWATAQSTAKSPVFVADLWTRSDWSKAETIDCIHPNDVGAQRMGLNWYDALKGILKPN